MRRVEQIDAGSRAVGPSASRRHGRVLSLVAFVSLLLVAIFAAQADGYTRYVASFGYGGSDAAGTKLPGGIAVSPDGSQVFVADTGNDRIDEFTSEGAFVRAWGWGVRDGGNGLQTCTEATGCTAGTSGRNPGQLNEPIGVAVAPDGTVYAINRAKFDGRVEAFDTSGEEVSYAGALPAGYGRTGAGEANLTYPLPNTNDVAIAGGTVYVGDNGEAGSRIFEFDLGTGALTDTLDLGALEFGPIASFVPAADGRIFVADGYSNLGVVDAAGNLLAKSSRGGRYAALAIEPDTGNLLAEPPEAPVNREITLTEYDGEVNYLGTIAAANMTTSSEEPFSYGLAISPTVQFGESEAGAIYVVDRFGNQVNVLAEKTPAEPLIGSVTAEEIGSASANLVARIEPVGTDTKAFFEYGTTSAYGAISPSAPGVDLGAGFAPKTAATHLSGLQPNTAYHYAVVATNANGTVTSADSTFTTFPVGGPFSLPDGRAFELASPDKGANNVGGVFAAPGGDGVVLTSVTPLPGSSSGGLGSIYVGLRGPDAWSREAASVPVEDTTSSNSFFVSSDLGQTVGLTSRILSPGDPAGEKLYLRDNATGTMKLITPTVPAGVFYRPYGASADFEHIFFEANRRLTPDTPEEGRQGLFEYSDEGLRNVGILPGASAPTNGEIAIVSGSGAVSENGSRVFFVVEPAPGQSQQVYARIDGARTVQVSASQATIPDPEGAAQPASFVGASADGSVAFFTSSARLTDDADTGEEAGEAKDLAPNLYRYDLATGKLTDLTVAADERGAQVSDVLVAAGGASAYFVAEGDLAAGATSGRPNLYRWSQGDGIRFVAGLNGGDPFASPGAAPSMARVTPDGSVLAFTSYTALDPAFPNAEGFNSNFESIREIYRYSAPDGSLTCISCARAIGSGTAQIPAQIDGRPEVSAGYGGNALSADGSRIFFTTASALAAQDTNGRNDVYEWEGGAARLISSGSGGGASFVDASASGDDVFLATGEQLVREDQDSFSDVYDAKVGGGLSGEPVAAPSCEGSACRPAPEAAPSTGAFGSRSFDGPPNRKPKHHRKHKKKHRKHRRHAKHHRRSHGRPTVGKRG